MTASQQPGDAERDRRPPGVADDTVAAAGKVAEAGHDPLAAELDTSLVGRNVLAGRWTFQVVEEFDDGYWCAVRAFERKVRDELLAGRRHVFESEMKERRRSHGQPGHERRPA